MHDIDSEKQPFSQHCWQILCLSSPSLVAAMMPLLLFFFPLSILPYFISFNAHPTLLPLPSFFLQVRMLESLSWLEQIAEKETEKGRAGEWREKKREEEHKVLEKEEREKRDGDDGEEKDSDHEDYGWTQQTGKVPGGWGGLMSMGGVKTPCTPHGLQRWRSSGSLGDVWTGCQSLCRDFFGFPMGRFY